MNLRYIRSTTADIDLLVKTRIAILRAANELDLSVNLSEVERQSREYYLHALEDDIHTAYLVYDQDWIIATGGISYYRVMPTYRNPTGKRAYIMNMYVDPEYRRNGIASHVLDLLIEDAQSRGINDIALEATAVGKPLYLARDFLPAESEMIFMGT